MVGSGQALGEIDMIKDLPPPTEAEEYRNTAEILRDLAAQARFGKTRNQLFNCADNLDRLAALAERQSEGFAYHLRVAWLELVPTPREPGEGACISGVISLTQHFGSRYPWLGLHQRDPYLAMPIACCD